MEPGNIVVLAGVSIAAISVIAVGVAACWKAARLAKESPKPADTEENSPPSTRHITERPVPMAPIYDLLLQPRHDVLAAGPSPRSPRAAVPVTNRISLKTFLMLLTGTLCIFIVGVFFWKLGDFLRRFTVGKVLGGGKAASVRYARTWYGWIPLDKYNSRKERRNRRFNKLRNMLARRSSHADYNWVFWDPGGDALDESPRGKRPANRATGRLKSNNLVQEDAIEISGPSLRDSGKPANPIMNSNQDVTNVRRPTDTERSGSSMSSSLRGASKVVGTMVGRKRRPPISQMLMHLDGVNERLISSVLSNSLNHAHNSRACSSSEHGSYPLMKRKARSESPLPTFPAPTGAIPTRSFFSLHYTSASHADGITERGIPRPRNVISEEGIRPLHTIPQFDGPSEQKRQDMHEQLQLDNCELLPPLMPDKMLLARRYKAWAARMQLHAFEQTPPQLRGVAGRPGSPLSSILASMMSSCQDSESSLVKVMVTARDSGAECLPIDISGQPSTACHWQGVTTRASHRHKSMRIPLNGYSLDGNGDSGLYIINSHKRPRSSSHSCNHSLPIPISQPAGNVSINPLPSRSISTTEDRHIQFRAMRNRRMSRSDPPPFSKRRLSDPEIRLIHDLDRKLEWLTSEVEPGRKPFHFLILANHWLNRQTWRVMDPVSRVASTTRRTYGDPRFNYPRPQEQVELEKQKYREPQRQKAHTPHIDSWRLAVNKVRRCSGLRELLKSIELYDGSADEPPDGAIDPACWILRRPPQGFEMSEKQKNAYYEGGTGWHEKLDTWQKIPRVYRIRNFVHEGRVNRRRIAEVARSAKRTCQKTARKVTPSGRPGNKSKTDPGREIRNRQSGCGSIPRRQPKKGTPRLKDVARSLRPVLKTRFVQAPSTTISEVAGHLPTSQLPSPPEVSLD
ncbi:hypothetical protein AJ80_06857 [Polytolypa hystricis UAMH7299]|uniref:Uncharacterized protein n=1 Tax=Polytolypa hystricis (strain UAMH7299) TaxID=1447883 RepID=A0A2B7XSE1_POLH7|nr:hypothetical protein AJ80_06857 [Polytolypa hystricis UAMH7299]